MTDKLLKKIAEEGTWHPQINEVMLAKYNCDYCVKGKWYCENKCPDRPPQYSPTKQQEFLHDALNSGRKMQK